MFPGKLAVIHTESYASGPSAVVPLSEIGQARPLQKHTAYVLREFRPSSCHLALSDVPHLTVPKSIVTCLSPHRLQYLAPPCLFYLLVCSCKLLTSCPTLVLTLSILLLLFLILLSHLRVELPCYWYCISCLLRGSIKSHCQYNGYNSHNMCYLFNKLAKCLQSQCYHVDVKHIVYHAFHPSYFSCVLTC